MGRAAAARRLASAAAYGGGGLSAMGLGLYGVLRSEAAWARRVIGEPRGRTAPDATGWYGSRRPGPTVRVALLGDSSAAGYGVERVEETPGARLASALSVQADRRVHLHSLAAVGAQSGHLSGQLDAALADPSTRPDLVVVLVGVNDITHRVLPATSIRHLSEAVDRIRAAGAEVLVGTCPDLGTIRPIPPPLKQVARIWSRRLAAAQTIAVVERGGRTVSLADLLGAEFDSDPSVFFGPDRFHPSAAGYRAVADVLAPSALAALGHGVEAEEPPEALRGEGLRPVAPAAVEAVATPGTELDAVEVAGARRGVRGLWVELRHRRRHPGSADEAPGRTASLPVHPVVTEDEKAGA